MGVEYDLISDATREGYELGRGAWGGDDLAAALRSADPAGRIIALLMEEGFTLAYSAEVAHEIAAFAAAHSDWRIVDDCGSWDGNVVDDEERAEMLAEGWDLDDEDFPLYKKVGSRYRDVPEARVSDPPDMSAGEGEDLE